MATFAILILLWIPTNSWGAELGELDKKIIQLRSHVKSGVSHEERVVDLTKIFNLTKEASPDAKASIAPETIDEISFLLGDPSDEIRAWAAGSLGNIGPPAQRALPRLETALAEVRKKYEHVYFGPTLSSEDPIVDAIGKISGKSPVPPK